MNSKTLSKIHKFGKAGKLVMTVLMVVAMIAAAASLAATIFVASLPKDAVTVRVTNHAEFRINANEFDSLWDILGGNFSYATDKDPEDMLKGENGKIAPPENQEFETELDFFDQSYSSAEISSDGSTKVIDAASLPSEYRSSDLVESSYSSPCSLLPWLPHCLCLENCLRCWLSAILLSARSLCKR